MNRISTPFTFQKTFKSNDNILGFDDEISRQRRNFIRQHYNSWHSPTLDIYEKETRQTEYGLKKITETLFQKDKPVDKKLLPSSYGIRRIDTCIETNSYRGESLVDAPLPALINLKKAGIKTVIDLAGYGERYREKVKKAGIKFFSFHIDFWFWNSPMFTRKLKENDDRTEINKFIEFINKLQEDFAYIACEFGSYKTDDALMLNSFFNPKANRHSVIISSEEQKTKMGTLFSNLNEQDLKKLGWTEDFNLKFTEMLKNAKVRPRTRF